MTLRESLSELVKNLPDDRVERLWAELAADAARRDRSGRGREPAWIEASEYPVLAEVWDNDDDAIFDET